MTPGERVTIYDKPKSYAQNVRRTHRTRFVHYADIWPGMRLDRGVLCVFRTTPLSRTFTRPLRNVVR